MTTTKANNNKALLKEHESFCQWILSNIILDQRGCCCCSNKGSCCFYWGQMRVTSLQKKRIQLRAISLCNLAIKMHYDILFLCIFKQIFGRTWRSSVMIKFTHLLCWWAHILSEHPWKILMVLAWYMIIKILICFPFANYTSLHHRWLGRSICIEKRRWTAN